mmetsp:Transcript_32469/g.70938  ORF Transcript_32469/g.70938 Transcript_32469/m.70938 type:complete len:104 (-) Transcript_32469:287-598(-)
MPKRSLEGEIESQLPLSRVKRLMKETESVGMVSAEASILVAKATDLFMELFSHKAGEHVIAANRSKLEYKDFASCVENTPRLQFLRDIVPMPVRASDIIEGLN